MSRTPPDTPMNYHHFMRIVMLATLLLSVMALGEDRTSLKTVRVIDEDGKPQVGVPVIFRGFDPTTGTSFTTGNGKTDKNGTVTLRPQYADWKVLLENAGGDGCSVGVGTFPDNGRQCLITDWHDPKLAGVCFEELWIDGNYNQQGNFDLVVRKPGEITSPWLAKELRLLLQESLDKGTHADALTRMCNNLENFDDLDLLSRIAAKHPELRAAVASVLDSDSDQLQRFWSVMNVKHEQYDDREGWERRFSALCHWRGLDDNPAQVDATLPKLQVELQGLTDRLLTAAEAVWPSRGIVCFPKLGRHARAGVPRFLQVMQDANASFLAWQWLKKCDPGVDQVRPFFQSKDPFVAFAAIDSVSDKLNQADAAIALATLRALSNPGIANSPLWPDPGEKQSNAIQMEKQLEKLMPKIEAEAKGIPAPKTGKGDNSNTANDNDDP